VPYCQKYTPTDCFFRRFCPLGSWVGDNRDRTFPLQDDYDWAKRPLLY